MGSTVHPRPSRTISTNTSGWCDSISTTSGAPIARSRRSIAVRVRDSAGNNSQLDIAVCVDPEGTGQFDATPLLSDALAVYAPPGVICRTGDVYPASLITLTL